MTQEGAAGGQASQGAGAVSVLVTSVRRALKGMVEVGLLFPGGIAIVVAYAVTAAALSSETYANLWGVVAAAGVGVAWYFSPLGRVEARRRLDRRTREAPPGTAAAPTAG